MQKIFIVAGELSGDKLGAWYVKRLRKDDPKAQIHAVDIHAVGGQFLQAAGATLYERFEKLNCVGLVAVAKKLRFLSRFLHDLTQHITSNEFDELVVVDFPGFNLRLIKKVKALRPDMKITYLSPPQLWVWGAGRIKTIKQFCDDVIVLYPFEVAWYKARGVEVQWLGYPFYEAFAPHFGMQKKQQIAIMPGSREIEIKRLLPLFLKIARRLKLAYPKTRLILPLAESIDRAMVEKILRQSAWARWGQDVLIVQGEAEKIKALSTCCLALTKPGTVTLELALLGVPAVVAYKAPWITYFIAKALVKIEYMALPNLLLKEPVYHECIQGDCSEKRILAAIKPLYQSFLTGTKAYDLSCKSLDKLKTMLRFSKRDRT